MAKRKGSLRLDHDSWYLRTYINGRQRSYRLGHRRDFISKDEINAAADRKLLELRQVTAGSMARIPLSGFVEKWYLETGDWRPSTRHGYRKLFERYIKNEQWATKPLWEYHSRDCQDILRAIAGKYRLSKTTLRHIKAFFSGVFRTAVLAGFRETNPWRDVVVPKGTKDTREVGAYTLAEVEGILSALELDGRETQPGDLRHLLPIANAAFAIASYAGLRLAEIQGLTWDDVEGLDGKAGTESGDLGPSIAVNQTRWRSYVSDPKSKASRSWVPMVPRLMAILRAYRDLPPFQAPRPGGRHGDYSASSLFPVSLDGIGRRVIRPRLKARGLQWKGWHSARRGLASNLFELGVDDLVVSRILRHSSVQITREAYIRRRDRRMEEAFSRLSDAMAKSGGGE